MAKEQKDQPRKRFCYGCESYIVSQQNVFNMSGHVESFESAIAKFKMTEAVLNKIENNRKSGKYDNKVTTIYGKENSTDG